MKSKIRDSREGACERVSASVQPVHSWKESQMTEGLLACSSASAMAGTIPGGNAIKDAVAEQNFDKGTTTHPLAAKYIAQGRLFDH